ncbi:hypothetical protein GKQ38_04750 [Candidatus Nanohaloarchaea archaeon]|nr:hypothetical protein GKQ38_04750 [Candidatus Nanohaloarchaea archaeon]
MKPEKVFKRYDIRGRYPEELNEEFAERLGKSIGTFAKNNFSDKVVVCRDNKETSGPLKEKLIEGLLSTGVKVLDAGIGPTDYSAFSGMKRDAVAVQVTSSHMPLNFNGFKLIYPEGNGFVNEDLNTVKDLFRNQDFAAREGTVESIAETMKDHYRTELIETAEKYSDGDFDKKIVVDSLGGAATDFLAEALEELGAEVVDIAEEKEKHPYQDPPNPKPENLEELEDRVKQENADLGIATDMDADRVTLYNGEFITGSEIFCLMAEKVPGTTVASIDTSQAVEDVVGSNGHEIYYTRVGDPFVMDEALEVDASLAGEPNGHYSVLDFVPYNSGSLTGLILAGSDIDSGLERVPTYHVRRDSIQVEDKNEKMVLTSEAVEDEYEVLSMVDGVKAWIEGAEVLIRPSGSSPKIRVISEAEREDVAERGLEVALDILQKA